MTMHTSGPWTAVLESDPSWEVYGLRRRVVKDRYGNVVARVPESQEKIAVLIAAAPEMLEACRTMLAWFESEKSGPDYGTQGRKTHPDGERIWREWWERQLKLCDDAERLSRAAIAKVEEKT